MKPTTTEPTLWQTATLFGLQTKQIYQGTVPANVRERRRKRNKAARVARRRCRQS